MTDAKGATMDDPLCYTIEADKLLRFYELLQKDSDLVHYRENDPLGMAQEAARTAEGRLLELSQMLDGLCPYLHEEWMRRINDRKSAE